MPVRISKKLIFVLLGIFLLILAGVSLWFQWGDVDWLTNLFKKKKSEPVEEREEQSRQEEEIETDDWQSPAGFSFSYNKLLTIDNHPEDQVNYAHLDLMAPEKKGSIKIIVNDSEYKDLDEWYQEDKDVKNGSAIDTEIAGLKAKKVVLSEPESKVVTAFIDADQVIYLIELNAEGTDRFWQKNYDLVLSSFKLIPLEGEEESSFRLLETEGLGEESGGEVIVEEEEVIE